MKPLLIVCKPKKVDGPGPHGEALEAKLREEIPDGFDLAVIPFGCEVVLIEPSGVRSAAELPDGLDEAITAEREACSHAAQDWVNQCSLRKDIKYSCVYDAVRNRGK